MMLPKVTSARLLSASRIEKDAERLSRLRSRVEAPGADPLVLAMMVQTAGNSRLH